MTGGLRDVGRKQPSQPTRNVPTGLPEEDLNRRLSSFFCMFREARPQQRGPRQAHALDADSLGRLLKNIGGACRNARESGDLVDVWDLAGLRSDEVRHSALLAWAVDPRSTHGLGRAILEAIWSRAVSYRDRAGIGVPAHTLMNVSSARAVHKELVPLSHQARRVDLCIDGDEMVVIVEVKIYAPEGDRQLQEYLEVAKARAAALQHGEHWAVLLVSDRKPSLIDPRLVHITWRDVSAAIRDVVACRSPSHLSVRLLSQFADRVSRFH